MIPVAVTCVGVLLVTVGLWLVYPPAALVVLGVVLAAAGLLVEFPGGDS